MRATWASLFLCPSVFFFQCLPLGRQSSRFLLFQMWNSPSSSSLVLQQTSSCLPHWFLWPPRASSSHQDEGLLRDSDAGGGGEAVEELGGYHVLPLSPTTDLWRLRPSLNICLSPCTVGDWWPLKSGGWWDWRGRSSGCWDGGWRERRER